MTAPAARSDGRCRAGRAPATRRDPTSARPSPSWPRSWPPSRCAARSCRSSWPAACPRARPRSATSPRAPATSCSRRPRPRERRRARRTRWRPSCSSWPCRVDDPRRAIGAATQALADVLDRRVETIVLGHDASVRASASPSAGGVDGPDPAGRGAQRGRRAGRPGRRGRRWRPRVVDRALGPASPARPAARAAHRALGGRRRRGGAPCAWPPPGPPSGGSSSTPRGRPGRPRRTSS